MRTALPLAALALAAGLAAPAAVGAQDAGMSFFVTSRNPGQGGNFGGLAGADAWCETLAAEVGAGERLWRAYLSTTAENARDRIGAGPWVNAEGVEIAASLEQLHGQNNLTKQTALDETGAIVNGRGDSPNRHDILTGSRADGTAAAQTCNDWTLGEGGSGLVGHHDRQGLDTSPPMLSWNSSHPSRGCSLPELRSTGGDGLLYCFAAD